LQSGEITMNHEMLLIAQLEAKRRELVWRELDPERRLLRMEWFATLWQPTDWPVTTPFVRAMIGLAQMLK
jgi:hypothetical protein